MLLNGLFVHMPSTPLNVYILCSKFCTGVVDFHMGHKLVSTMVSLGLTHVTRQYFKRNTQKPAESEASPVYARLL